MRIADAVRFYSAIHARWDAARLKADFDACGLRESFEVRRMKRAYQRALVLALACAALPEMLVVENAEEFDEAPAAALLAAAIARGPSALATFGGDARPAADLASAFDEIVPAAGYRARVLA
jgi:hypothetical protein